MIVIEFRIRSNDGRKTWLLNRLLHREIKIGAAVDYNDSLGNELDYYLDGRILFLSDEFYKR